MIEPVWALDAWQIADLVRSGDLSAQEVLDVFLERIDACNTELNAFGHMNIPDARARSAEIDRLVAAGEDPGPFAGVPIGVKEDEGAQGLPMRLGSLLLKDQVAPKDSITVDRLRAAGCIVVGTTTLPEFGATSSTWSPLHGTTRNPWNLQRTPGGSSGGSAAAVASALLPLATGGDGGGSTRTPASYSGLFGMKGTYGRIPVEGLGGPETVVRGPQVRSVRDSARFHDCVIGPDERDPHSLPRPDRPYEEMLDELPSGLRAAWSADLGYGACSQEVERIVRAGADDLAAAAGLTWTDAVIELHDMSEGYLVLAYGGLTQLMGDILWERKEDLTPYVLWGLEYIRDNPPGPQTHMQINQRRQENNVRLAELFETVDVLITPTTATTAYTADELAPMKIDGRPIARMHWVTCTYPFNFSGHPAASIPCGLDAMGLPVGLQVITRRHDDHLLFALARAFEQARPWPKIAPRYTT